MGDGDGDGADATVVLVPAEPAPGGGAAVTAAEAEGAADGCAVPPVNAAIALATPAHALTTAATTPQSFVFDLPPAPAGTGACGGPGWWSGWWSGGDG